MPNYSAATLSDAQARDIYAYVRTFKSNAPPADQIPVLNDILKAAQRPYKK
jgi:mono/diheme cytochrome c family protein